MTYRELASQTGPALSTKFRGKIPEIPDDRHIIFAFSISASPFWIMALALDIMSVFWSPSGMDAAWSCCDWPCEIIDWALLMRSLLLMPDVSIMELSSPGVFMLLQPTATRQPADRAADRESVLRVKMFLSYF